MFQKQGLINLWYDADISPGTNWEEEIQKHLETAQIILLLISPNFMASDYCYSKEMKQALERHEDGDARVIPIILRPVHWQLAPFGKLQALPKDAKPVKSWRDSDKAFVDVVTGILMAIEQLTKQSREPAETILMKLNKTLEVPLIEPTDAEPTSKQPQFSAISTTTHLSPNVSEGKDLHLSLEGVEQALRDELDWDDLPAQIEDFKDELPSLTVNGVKSVWDKVLNLVKERSKMIAAMLSYYNIVSVKGTSEQTVIVIRAQKQGHYNFVNGKDRAQDVEWALTTVLGQNCKVRLLPPESPLEPQFLLPLVQEAWDKVISLVKERSPAIAAMLSYYDVVSVEGTSEQAIIVIRAQKQGHYGYISGKDRAQDVEWALTTVLGQNCRVHLLPPESPLDHSI